jgi:hypothetical protein
MQAIKSDGLRASLPLPPLRAGRLEFGLDDLHDLRAQVAATATAVGLGARREQRAARRRARPGDDLG